MRRCLLRLFEEESSSPLISIEQGWLWNSFVVVGMVPCSSSLFCFQRHGDISAFLSAQCCGILLQISARGWINTLAMCNVSHPVPRLPICGVEQGLSHCRKVAPPGLLCTKSRLLPFVYHAPMGRELLGHLLLILDALFLCPLGWPCFPTQGTPG